MIVEYLSDHVGDLLKESRQKLTLLEDEQTYWLSALREAEDASADAERHRSFWRRLFNLPSDDLNRLQEAQAEARYHLRSVRTRIAELDDEIGTRQGGAEGERRFEGELGWLSDEWTMFRGYRNQRGEADAVLVGPDGVWTIEVKNWRVRLRVDGDNWYSRNLDGRGERPATDRGGRSPARQVSEIAGSLARRLQSVGHGVPVRTAVVVLNDHARIESCRRPGIDFVGTSTGVFADRMLQLATPLAASDVTAIQQLVRDDHGYWRRRAAIKGS